MYMAGVDLHRITLGALIIALGLLVDDAIIAIEMMVVKMEQGWDRLRAATFAWSSTAFPMLTGTLITAAGFLPVGFAKSTAGEYAGGILWVVGLALIASWVVAVLFTPYLGVKLLPDFAKHGASGDPEAIYATRSYRALRRLIEGTLRRRKSVVAVTVLLFLGAVACFGLVQQQFFPTSTRSELFFELRLPEGTAIGVTDAAAAEAEKLLAGDPDIVTYTTYVGQGSPRFWLGLNPVLPNQNFAQIVIVTKDLAARERVKARLEKAIAGGALPEARARIDGFVFGPPVGFPVQFRVVGPHPNGVRAVAEKIRQAMAANPTIVDPHLDWSEQVKSIRLEVNQDRARALRLTPQQVAQMLQVLLSGLTITQYREGIEHIDVVARAVANERLDLNRLPGLTITTRNGIPVPLSQIARINYEFEEPILWRRNRDLVLTARGDIVDGVQAPDVSNEVLAGIKPIKERCPRLSHRDGRLDRGKRQGQFRARRCASGHAGRDAGASDDPASELFAACSRVGDSPARGDRRGRRSASDQPTLRLCRAARTDCACRDDHAQHHHFGRSDRPRHHRRSRPASRHCRCDGQARATRAADRACGNSRHDSAGREHFLGPDGDHHHGRPFRSDAAHASGRARALCALVPRAHRPAVETTAVPPQPVKRRSQRPVRAPRRGRITIAAE
jgi:hypothetical protein